MTYLVTKKVLKGRQVDVSLRGRRLKGKGKGVLSERNARGARGRREGNACQETIVFLVINIYQQANVKILIGQNLIRSK